MKCRAAMLLIASGDDGYLTPSQRHALEAHLAVCPSCRALAADITSTVSLLEDAASAAERSPGLSPEFKTRLRSRLLDERARRETRPIAHVVRSIRHLAQSRPVLARAASRVASVLVFLAVTLAGFAILSLPPQHISAPPPGRLASFTVQSAPDGRLYAALAQHAVAPRSRDRRATP